MSFSNPLHTKSHKETFFLDTAAYYLLLALSFIAPFVVALSATSTLLNTKILVSGVLVLGAVAAFSVGRLQAQILTVPKVLLLGGAWLIPLAYLVSSVVQSNSSLSLMGERLQVDSFMYVLIAALTLTLAALVLHTKERVLSVYLAVLGGGTVLAVLELVIFFARDSVAAIGITFPALSLLGSLNDLAVFFGLLTTLALASLSLLPLTNMVRGLLWATLAVSGFFLVVVNLSVLWWIIGFFALAFLVYSVTGTREHGSKQTFSVAALAVVALSALFLVGGESVTTTLASWANVGELDVRPSWTTTIELGQHAYQESALFGTGPGTFTRLWSEYRPIDVDQTPFWNANFAFGIGFLPTSFITAGLIAAVAWLTFLGLFLWSGIRTLVLARGEERDAVAAYLRTSSFVGAAYLWIILFIQVPSPILITYAFLLTGLYISSLRFGSAPAREWHLSFQETPRAGFVVTLVLTLVVLGCVSGVYSLGTRYAAEASFAQAVQVANTSTDIDKAEMLVNRAITLHPSDTYYRLRSTIAQVRIQQLVAENKTPDEVRDRFQTLLSGAIADAQQATAIDSHDYQNWVALGTVYQSIVPLGIEGAAESALAAYDRALELRPDAPALLLAKASIARDQGDSETARTLVEKAISVRNRYTDAIFLLAQLQIENNELENAVRSVQAATLFDPNNPVGFFQLGLLQYSAGNFADAAQAFERAVALNTVYANARYFLGLSYSQLGQQEKALAQFVEVQKTNPDNTELAQIIENLRAGRQPFQNLVAEPPIEELTAPPVSEPLEEGVVEGPGTSELSE